jgi:hypothetical protein
VEEAMTLEQSIEDVLRGNGITDRPEEFDSDIHSWRCSHPEIYGRCTCFNDLINDIVEAVKNES